MARKKKPEDHPPSKAYLVSFGDTMTTLLAFFIVLCSLAEDQTGANLYSGTGSFIRTISAWGLPGTFNGKTARNPVKQQSSSPYYVAESMDSDETDSNPVGPEEENGIRSIDRENEIYQRFLNELERLASVQTMPETKGEVVFDLFNEIGREPPYLTQPYREAFARIVPTLRRSTHRVEVVVWATMPSSSAWNRATIQAWNIAEELARLANLSPRQQSRLQPVGRPWRFADVKRPVLSIVVRRVNTTAD